MVNELERLAANVALQLVLSHYAEAGETGPGEWQDRVVAVERVEARLLPRLHGELIAHEWIEQNTHQTIQERTGVPRCCYRVTEAGLVALKQVLTGPVAADDVLSGLSARSEARRSIRNQKARTRRQRRQKKLPTRGDQAP